MVAYDHNASAHSFVRLETGFRLLGSHRHARSFGPVRTVGRMIASIAAIYKEPTFQTRGFQDHTAEGKLNAGITFKPIPLRYCSYSYFRGH